MTDQPKPPPAPPSMSDQWYVKACSHFDDRGSSGNDVAALCAAVLSLRCSVVELIELLTEQGRGSRELRRG